MNAKPKPGYKQTEVGVIPVEWDIKPLASLAERIMVGIASAATHAYRARGVPLLRNQNIKSGYLDDADIIFVDPEYETTFRNKRLRCGDLLTARTGYPGMTCIVPARYESAQSFTTLITRPKPEKVDCSYLCHFINSKEGQRFFDQSEIGGAQKNVNAGTLRGMPIPVPQLVEQRVIAEALSDVDALIGAFEKLIVKKRAIKQAAMQQLLTGKTRVPGFGGEWKTSTFEELFEILRSANNSRADLFPDGECGYLHYGDIHLHGSAFMDCYHEMKTFIPANRVHGTPTMRDGDLVMVDASEDTEAIGKAVEIAGLEGRKAVAGLHTILLRSRPGRLADGFKGYLQYFAEVRASLVRMATGVSVYGISKSAVKTVSVTIPDVPEQAAIAAALSDMDAQIAALEQRREKTKAIKQGMMQQLLTGRIRLVKPEAPAVEAQPLRKASKAPNWQISEEVLISVLSKQFGSERFPLGRMRRMKLTYLLRRHLEGQVEGYLKKAAGPYNPKTKYGGPETIALRKGYVREHKNGDLQGFVAGENIAQADAWFDQWYGPEARAWLERFRRKKNEELELLATVDMAAEELRDRGIEVTVATVKDVIQAGKEWKAKLGREVFSDGRIARAIEMCRTLFG